MRAPDHFARFIREAVSRIDRVACFEQGGPHVSLIWPEMAEHDWRDAVITALDNNYVKDAKFIEPTAEHPDWSFIAQRKRWPH